MGYKSPPAPSSQVLTLAEKQKLNAVLDIRSVSSPLSLVGTDLQVGATGAPTDVDYLVKTASGSLSAERVVTDTSSITWDWATAGQAKAGIPDAGVTLAKLANIADATMLGNNTGGSAAPIALTASEIRTLLGLVIGTNVQAYDAELAAVAGVTSAANKVLRFTGSGTADVIDLSQSTWTATASGGVNLDSTTVYSGTYLRILNIVLGTINFDADATAAASTTTTIELSLPIASNFTGSGDCGGAGTIATSPHGAVEIGASAVNDTMYVTWKSSVTTSQRVRIIFCYLIR